jgi:ABC-type sugar transport system permease subunit
MFVNSVLLTIFYIQCTLAIFTPNFLVINVKLRAEDLSRTVAIWSFILHTIITVIIDEQSSEVYYRTSIHFSRLDVANVDPISQVRMSLVITDKF